MGLDIPVSWPLQALSKDQATQLKDCDIGALSMSRYPENLAKVQLLDSFDPVTACDHAALSHAFAVRLEYDEVLSEEARLSFYKAISMNYGFIFADALFSTYFGEFSIVETPGFTQQEITDLTIQYEWFGLGDPWQIAYGLIIQQVNTEPLIQTDPITLTLSSDPDPALIQALAPALTDLIPVRSKFTLEPCTDNYINWSVKMVLEDGTEITVETDSNFLRFGGPWFVEVGDQVYMQYSLDFYFALADLITSLDLPYGQIHGMTCRMESIFQEAIP